MAQPTIESCVARLVRDDVETYSRILASAPYRGITPSLRQTDTLISTLVNLAMISTFLAAVQAQVITLTVQNNSTTIEVTTNTLFFVGLFLDVLGGCIAYMGVVGLQRIHALVLRRTSEASTILAALERRNSSTLDSNISTICQHLRFSEAMFLRVLDDLRAWDYIVPYLKRALDGVEEFFDSEGELREKIQIHLKQYKDATNELARSRLGATFAFSTSVAATTTTFAGVVCFILGLLCFVKNAQPVGVWATSFGAVGGALLLLGAVFVHVFRLS